jgi:hypothetical protein
MDFLWLLHRMVQLSGQLQVSELKEIDERQPWRDLANGEKLDKDY